MTLTMAIDHDDCEVRREYSWLSKPECDEEDFVAVHSHDATLCFASCHVAITTDEIVEMNSRWQEEP